MKFIETLLSRVVGKYFTISGMKFEASILNFKISDKCYNFPTDLCLGGSCPPKPPQSPPLSERSATMNAYKAVSDTVLDMINVVYHDKPFIFIIDIRLS